MSTPDALAAEFRKEAEKWPGMDESEGVKAWFWFRAGALVVESCQSQTAPNADLVTRLDELLDRLYFTRTSDRVLLEECRESLASRLEAMGTAPQHEKLIAEIDEARKPSADKASWDLLTRCRTALASAVPVEQRIPREPTEAMIEAGRRGASDENDVWNVSDLWRAMYDVASPQDTL